MDFFTVTVSLVPDDDSVHFNGRLSYSVIVLACDQDDARQEVFEFCKKHFNAFSIAKVRVKKV